MVDFVESQQVFRIGLFLAGFSLFAILEIAMPWRGISQRSQRWVSHFFVIAIGSLITRLLFSSGAVGASLWASSEGIGLMNWIDLPAWLEVFVCFVLLDGVIYWQHRAFHTIPACWRFHRYHHEDTQLDVSSALRFHPVEMVLSMAIKILAIVVLGVPLFAVLLFEIFLNVISMFNHSDWRLPPRLERVLRHILVTPDMHRIHHSITADDMRRNYGFNLSCWDHLFGSYRALHSGHVLAFGVPNHRK